MKKQVSLLFATALLNCSTALAVNPFSDVTSQEWSYQAIEELANQGVIAGYVNGTFKGHHSITRYEMAQMIGKALVNQNHFNAEQSALVNRLANEYSDELKNLGITVNKLENKIGNFNFTGDIQFKFENTKTKHASFSDSVFEDVNEYANMYGLSMSNASTSYRSANEGTGVLKRSKRQIRPESAYEEAHNPEKNVEKESKFSYRARLQFSALINDNTKAVLRLSSENKEFGDNTGKNISLDRVYVQHNFSKLLTTTVGRHDAFIGGGLTYDGALEGTSIVVGKDKLNFGFTYGYAPDMAFKLANGRSEYYPEDTINEARILKKDQKDNSQLAVLQVNGKLGENIKAGTFYTKVNGMNLGEAVHNTIVEPDFESRGMIHKSLDFYGAYASVKLGDRIVVNGEYAKFREIFSSQAKTIGVTLGNYNIKKKGTWSITTQYTSLGEFAPIFASTYWVPANQSYKAWSVLGKYAIHKDAGVAAYAAFDAKDSYGDKLSNYYRVDFNYQF